ESSTSPLIFHAAMSKTPRRLRPVVNRRDKRILMARLRVHNFSISVDGYGAGPQQSLENPIGVGGRRLHDWLFGTRTLGERFGRGGGDVGLDDAFARQGETGIGATIMGRNMFGPIRGAWDDGRWTGWWGDDPPFHHPVFVLTHYARKPITMAGGTT